MPDNAIAALEQKMKDLEADVSRTESKGEEAEAEGDAEGLKYWRQKELQLREKEQQQLRHEEQQLRDQVLQQGDALQHASVVWEGFTIRSLRALQHHLVKRLPCCMAEPSDKLHVVMRGTYFMS